MKSFFRALNLSVLFLFTAQAVLAAPVPRDVQTYLKKVQASSTKERTLGGWLDSATKNFPKADREYLREPAKEYRKEKPPKIDVIENRVMVNTKGQSAVIDFVDLGKGDLKVNGKAIKIHPTDSFQQIAYKISAAFDQKKSADFSWPKMTFVERAEALAQGVVCLTPVSAVVCVVAVVVIGGAYLIFRTTDETYKKELDSSIGTINKKGIRVWNLKCGSPIQVSLSTEFGPSGNALSENGKNFDFLIEADGKIKTAAGGAFGDLSKETNPLDLGLFPLFRSTLSVAKECCAREGCAAFALEKFPPAPKEGESSATGDQ